MFGVFALGEYVMRFRNRSNKRGARSELWSLLVVVAGVIGGMLGGLSLANWTPGSIAPTRYATFGCSDRANLGDGALWPVGFAVKELTAREEARIVELVKKAVS